MKRITIGDECIISWNTQIIDSDFHHVFSEGKIINDDAEIIIGNHVWIASHVIILKGTTIPEGCVVACGSMLKGRIMCNANSLISGFPVKILRNNIMWKR